MRACYEVVVLGAGPAGLAAAITIRRETRASVLVADAGLAVRERLGETVGPDLLLALKRLGLHEQFRSAPHLACPGTASIWGAHRVGYNDYVMSPAGAAWRLERRAFDEMMARAAVGAGIELCWGARYLRRATEEEGHRLLICNREGAAEVRARWVVDATGPEARFASDAGAHRIVDDRMYGLVRYAKIRSGIMSMQTLLEADEDGWWYAARLPDERVVVLFVGEGETVRRFKVRGHEEFERSLAATRLIGRSLAEVALEAETYAGAPVYSTRLDRPEGNGWIAVGDAAASYDPIVARGITKAVEDGIAAGRRIAERDGGGAYVELLAERFHAYAEARARLYEIERRDGPFWRTRRERSHAMLRSAASGRRSR